MGLKRCQRCKIEKPVDQFAKNGFAKDGLQYECKSCNHARRKLIPKKAVTCLHCGSVFYTNRKARLCSPECQDKRRYEVSKRSYKDRNLRVMYGITIEKFEEMLREQNFRCAVCGIHHEQTKGKGTLHVDHCHTTGKVRALLCHYCNTAIGALREDPVIIRKAAEYLEKHLAPPSP